MGAGQQTTKIAVRNDGHQWVSPAELTQRNDQLVGKRTMPP